MDKDMERPVQLIRKLAENITVRAKARGDAPEGSMLIVAAEIANAIADTIEQHPGAEV